tara:strand:+ start:728 stop:964 length:237 start_codon:yes stop_codon:yes gene_type:complete
MSKSFNIEQLSSKLNNIDKKLKDIERDELIKKYGTFLDSKKDILQLYILFMFFGVNMETIRRFPETEVKKDLHEYEVD